jgi:hypothetical protein
MDLMELPVTKKGNKYLLVFTDYLTKWVEAVPVANKDAATVAKAFYSLIICRHGIPAAVISDQGGEFCGAVMKIVYEWFEIKKLQTSPYHPQCNGLTERFNRTFINMLRAYSETQNPQEWDERLPALLFAYRTHFNRNSKKSPFYLLYGRNPVTPDTLLYGDYTYSFGSRDDFLREHVATLPQIWKFVRESLETQARETLEQTKKQLAEGKLQVFKVGDRVYARVYESIKGKVAYKDKEIWRGPYIVSRVISLSTYEVRELDSSKTMIVWTGHLKPDRAMPGTGGPAAAAPATGIVDHDSMD